MKTERECPLCGKEIKEDEDLCEHCREYVDNQYNDELTRDSDISGEDHNINEPIAHLDDETKVEPPKNKKSKTLIFFLVGCVLVVIIGIWAIFNVLDARKLGETEEMYWSLCIEENTVTSYSKYLVRFPEGKYADLAYEKIENIRTGEIEEWENLKKSTDANAYYLFISDNPESPHLAEAKNRMDSLIWMQTVEDGSAESYEAYLSNIDLGNFEGAYSQEAKRRYDYLSQIKPLKDSALDSLIMNLGVFYKSMSALDKKALVESLDSTFLYYNDTLTNLAIVDTLKQVYKRNNIQEVVYSIADSTVSAQQDQYGLIFVDLTVNSTSKSMIENKTKKKAKPQFVSTTNSDTLHLKINSQNKVVSIEQKREANKIF